MYTEHEMKAVDFDTIDVFADLEFASEGENGEDEYSIRPHYSDK